MHRFQTLSFLPCLQRSRGFTLVELLLVIFLLSSLALVTTLFVDNANEQYRFDATKTRLEQIRRAIIGDTSRTLNGQPEISGFVADMGRLPANLQELIESPVGAVEWGLEPIAVSGVVATLPGGWRGPYLEAIQESGVSGVRAYRDGWGNPDVTGDEANFGWKFKLKDSGDIDTAVLADAVALTVQSLGVDGVVGQADANNPYQADYPNAGYRIALNDWAQDLADKSFNIQLNGVPANTTTGLELHIYRLIDGEFQTEDEYVYKSNPFDVESVSGVVTPPVATFDDTHRLLPIGTHAAAIVCADRVTIYDGDCSGAAGRAPFIFNLIPRSQLPTIQWNITP